MGRLLLLIVAGIAAASLVLTRSVQEDKTRGAARQALSEHEHLAREAALSGLNVAIGTLARDYAYRHEQDGIRLDGNGAHGTYDLTVEDGPMGTVRVRTVGRSGAAQGAAAVRLDAEVIRLSPLPGALVVNANELQATFDGTGFQVRGADVRPPSVSAKPLLAGAGALRPAMIAARQPVATALADALTSGQRARVSGVSAQADVATQSLPALIDHLFHEGRAAATTPERFAAPSNVFSNQTLGSPVAPTVIYVRGNAHLAGSTIGHGLLIVEGDLTMEGKARWEGVVLVASAAHRRRRVTLRDDAAVYGALVLHGQEELEAGKYTGFPSGHMDVDVFRGGTRIYHQHEYDKKYNLTSLDLTGGPGLSTHWSAFRTAQAGRTLRMEFFNAFNGSGSYLFQAGATTYSGMIRDGFSALVPIDSLTSARLLFANLKELRGTNPSSVRADNSGRDRSLTVRFYDGTSLVYEVSAYEHDANGPRDGVGVTEPPSVSVPANETGEYGNFQFHMSGNAQIRYSEEAVGRLAPRIKTLHEVVRLRAQLQGVRVL